MLKLDDFIDLYYISFDLSLKFGVPYKSAVSHNLLVKEPASPNQNILAIVRDDLYEHIENELLKNMAELSYAED